MSTTPSVPLHPMRAAPQVSHNDAASRLALAGVLALSLALALWAPGSPGTAQAEAAGQGAVQGETASAVDTAAAPAAPPSAF